MEPSVLQLAAGRARVLLMLVALSFARFQLVVNVPPSAMWVKCGSDVLVVELHIHTQILDPHCMFNYMSIVKIYI
jgi:hypothetical protein